MRSALVENKEEGLAKAQAPELSVTWFLSRALSIDRMKPRAWLKTCRKPVRRFMPCNGTAAEFVV